MKKCCITSCPKPANSVCFDIPKDAQKRKDWMININRDKYVTKVTNDDTAAVCSLHFKQSDYIYLLHGDEITKRKISEDAVPSVFPWTHDWHSNYKAEMEITHLNERSSHSLDSQTSIPNIGLPEGETVQLGNVESLGIVAIENTCPDSSASSSYSGLSSEKTKNLLVNTIQSKPQDQGIQLSTSTSNSNSRVETSEDEDIKHFNILSQIHYSCISCEFKSKDIISLREHRMKHHPEIKSEPINGNWTDRKCHEIRNYESSVRQFQTQERDKSSSQFPVQASQCDEHKDKRKASCVKDPQDSKDNPLRQQKHRKKTDFGNEIPVVKHAETRNNNMDPLPALFSKANSPQSSRRHVKYWYICTQCSFRTPNAKKLKGHVKENHPVTTKTSIEHSSRLKTTISSSLASSYQEPNGTSKTSDNTGPSRYFCELCNFSVNKLGRLKNHRRRHTEDSRYRCSKCSYSVTTKRQLTFHETNHHLDCFFCNRCNYKTKSLTEKNHHYQSVHNTATAGKISSCSSKEPSNSDCDLEHVCTQCSFKTSSRDRFHSHEKTHVTTSVGSSTEELEVQYAQRKTTRKMKRKREDSSSSIRTAKLIERLVYECPHCSFWARAVSSFHQHLMAHEKTPTFKCSNCDFSARYRIAITKHIKKSPKETHGSACWIMTKSIPETQYPEYLKTSLIPELEYSGSREITSLVSDEGLKIETSSDNSSWKLCYESPPENNTDDGSQKWVPSTSLSSAQTKDDSSSSLSLEITSDSSLGYKRKLSSCSSSSSDSRLKAKNQSSARNSFLTDKSSPSPTSGKVLRSSSRTRRPRCKRLRIQSDDETEEEISLKLDAASASNGAGNEKSKLSVSGVQQETNTQSQILAILPQSHFPALDDASAEHQAKERLVKEAQDRINEMRTEQLKMAEADSVSELELLKLKENKKVAEQRLMKLSGQKIEAELQLRTQQCQELKFSLAMYEPGQESDFSECALVESQKLVAESEARLGEITRDIADLRKEIVILDCQIKESEDSHAGAVQLLEIFENEMSDKEAELVRLQEDLAKSVSSIRELVAEERKLIETRTAMFKEELKRLYMNGLSKIREKERNLLNALDNYLADKSISPNVDETIN